VTQPGLLDSGSQPLATALTGAPEDGRRRRIAYFMLFRLGMLTALTVLAAAATWSEAEALSAAWGIVAWSTIGVGYLLSLLWARALPRVRRLELLVALQTGADLLLSILVVQVTGGVDSGFAFLYLISVLGAAVMGHRRLVLSTTVAAVIAHLMTAGFEAAGWLVPLTLTDLPVARLAAEEVVPIALRTAAAIGGVGWLSSYLATQLVSSTRQVGTLRALHENIVNSLSSGLITTDGTGTVVTLNPAARQILGLGEKAVGRRLEELLPGLPTLAPGEAHARVETDFRRADGHRLHLGVGIGPLLDGEGRDSGRIVGFQDVTRLHELALDLRRSERLAAVGQLAASVAHEIRNPLAAIAGSAELLQLAGASEDDRRLLAIVTRESTRLNALVADLLAFTRPRTPEAVPVDLSRTAAEIAEAFRSDPANERVTLRLAPAAGAVWVAADPGLLGQMLWNLLRNAGEATGHAGTVDVRVEREEGFGVLVVADDGPGVPDDLRDRIFDPFFTTKPGGTGFGLALVHRMAEEHGGAVHLRPPEAPETGAASGATFALRLPLAAAPASGSPRT
jgi:two-component system sensor histidine kinase PilS (NtrC family)